MSKVIAPIHHYATRRVPAILLLLGALFSTGSALSAQDRTPLPIPPLLGSSVGPEGERIFHLTARTGQREFVPGVVTPTLGYNGDYLGPTIRVSRGDNVSIRVENRLPDPTTVHWHGAHVPAEADGGPHQLIGPGERWEARFKVNQNAATLWYHPHMDGTTGEQVYNGLAGFLIVDDGVSNKLPSEYGVDDIPVVLQERRFDRAGRLVYRPGMHDTMNGYFGNALLTNGAIEPLMEAAPGLLRLRLLNGSNSTVLRIYLSGEAPFLQIASDGGYLNRAVEQRQVILSPGERAEIVLDLCVAVPTTVMAETNAGTTYTALAIQPRPDEDAPVLGMSPDDLSTAALTTIQRIPEEDAVRTRSFNLSTMGPGGLLTINGRSFDMDRIDEQVVLGTTEIWDITNGGGRGGRGMMGGMMSTPHNFHVHGLQFQVLSVNGRSPAPNLRGWKDTILLWPNDRIRIIMRFEDFEGVYMYHCHLLEHEDQGMMGQYTVVRP